MQPFFFINCAGLLDRLEKKEWHESAGWSSRSALSSHLEKMINNLPGLECVVPCPSVY